MSVTVAELVDRLVEDVIDGTVIDGGHYLLDYKHLTERVVHRVNPDSCFTFAVAAQLYARAKAAGLSVGFYFLVGDLGVPAALRSAFNRSFEFPPEYQRILTGVGILANDVVLQTESWLRNRARQHLKSARNQQKIVLDSSVNAYRLNWEHYGIMNDDEVSNRTSDPTKTLPNCRLLIAHSLQDKERQGYRNAVNICNQAVYQCMGRFASVYHHLLAGQMPVINAFVRRTGGELHLELTRYLPVAQEMSKSSSFLSG